MRQSKSIKHEAVGSKYLLLEKMLWLLNAALLSHKICDDCYIVITLLSCLQVWDLESKTNECKEQHVPAPDLPIRSISIVREELAELHQIVYLKLFFSFLGL